MLEAENWVAVAFLCFLGLLAYLGAHRKMIDAIDRRQTRIKSELGWMPRFPTARQGVPDAIAGLGRPAPA